MSDTRTQKTQVTSATLVTVPYEPLKPDAPSATMPSTGCAVITQRTVYVVNTSTGKPLILRLNTRRMAEQEMIQQMNDYLRRVGGAY